MSCHKVSRELLERFRFGEELDARSAPHLAHLQVCVSCREEVGIDRALLGQLRRALQARVDGYAPSPSSWELVRDRALAAEASRPWTSWLGGLLGGLRAAGAAAAVALVVALGAVNSSGNDAVADFQLRASSGGAPERLANAMPTDLPPYERPHVCYTCQTLPPPAAGRMSVIMTYTATGAPIATTRPVPALVSGLLR
jgi:anti-sigma factor RsiW